MNHFSAVLSFSVLCSSAVNLVWVFGFACSNCKNPPHFSIKNCCLWMISNVCFQFTLNVNTGIHTLPTIYKIWMQTNKPLHFKLESFYRCQWIVFTFHLPYISLFPFFLKFLGEVAWSIFLLCALQLKNMGNTEELWSQKSISFFLCPDNMSYGFHDSVQPELPSSFSHYKHWDAIRSLWP